MTKQLTRDEEIELAYAQLAKEQNAEKERDSEKAWAEREAPSAESLFDLAKR